MGFLVSCALQIEVDRNRKQLFKKTKIFETQKPDFPKKPVAILEQQSEGLTESTVVVGQFWIDDECISNKL